MERNIGTTFGVNSWPKRKIRQSISQPTLNESTSRYGSEYTWLRSPPKRQCGGNYDVTVEGWSKWNILREASDLHRLFDLTGKG